MSAIDKRSIAPHPSPQALVSGLGVGRAMGQSEGGRIESMTRPIPQRVHFLTRLRVMLDDSIALGPGKADLLEAIRGSGSIVAAASSLGMSYMRAWKLVRTMNGCFASPLVVATRG